MTLEEIINAARRYKACEKASAITDAASAVAAILSPQGREFALHTGYPRLEDLRASAEVWKDIPEVSVDKGRVDSSAHETIAAGDTEAVVAASGPERLYRVMAMHGAKVRIEARDYAVVTATNVGGEIEVANDGTAVVNIEEKR